MAVEKLLKYEPVKHLQIEHHETLFPVMFLGGGPVLKQRGVIYNVQFSRGNLNHNLSVSLDYKGIFLNNWNPLKKECRYVLDSLRNFDKWDKALRVFEPI